MMSILANRLKQKILAKQGKIKILLTEGWNQEIQKAASFLHSEGLIEPIVLLRTKNESTSLVQNIQKIIIDELDISKYQDLFYELRKNKGISKEQAQELAKQPNYLSALLLKNGDIDGVICGIEYSTKDTLRAALQIIKKNPDSEIVTSAMMLECDNELLIFGDISLTLNPNDHELASITKEIVKFAKDVIGFENLNTAMLSYSTIGSGAGESVDKVRKAYELVKGDEHFKTYNANVYGEIQFDAAYVDSVRKKKAPNCPWDKKPNIFIFPNLDAGNIGYKILERCAGYSAVGPVVIGLDKPMNDLSRGATANSVVEISYITASQVK